jgi:hypothetical protein
LRKKINECVGQLVKSGQLDFVWFPVFSQKAGFRSTRAFCRKSGFRTRRGGKKAKFRGCACSGRWRRGKGHLLRPRLRYLAYVPSSHLRVICPCVPEKRGSGGFFRASFGSLFSSKKLDFPRPALFAKSGISGKLGFQSFHRHPICVRGLGGAAALRPPHTGLRDPPPRAPAWPWVPLGGPGWPPAWLAWPAWLALGRLPAECPTSAPCPRRALGGLPSARRGHRAHVGHWGAGNSGAILKNITDPVGENA